MGRWIRVDHVFRENAILLWGFNGLRKNHHSVTLGNTHQTTSKSQWMQRNICIYCIQTRMYANDIFMNWNQHYICATICLSKHYICPDSLARISGVALRKGIPSGTLKLGIIQCQPWWQDLPFRHWYGDWPVFGLQKCIPQLVSCGIKHPDL